MKRSFLILLLVLFHAAPAGAADGTAIPDELLRSGGDHPLGVWDGSPPRNAAATVDDRWSLRTGFRKGVFDLSLDEERTAAPDVAVLRSGSFGAWRGLLAAFQEPSVVVEPDAVAGLWTTKPVLIIPSGGLAGLAASEFFRAGLTEYVSSGGVVLCLTQQRGSDLSALPVPPGSTLAASGWTEDSGPLVGASRVVSVHPALADRSNPTPAIETDGFIIAHPPSATVLLARSDGRPTLILYSVGKGWVIVSMTASDSAAERDALAPEEQQLVHDLVLWAKAGGNVTVVAPGRALDLPLTVQGPEQGTAAFLSVRVIGRADARPLDERLLPLAVPAMQAASLTYSTTIPPDTAPGIYHLEYRLLDSAQQPLSPVAEFADGWISVPSLPARTVSRAADTAPLPPAPLAVEAVPIISFTGDQATMTITVSRSAGTAGTYGIIIRTAGQERRATLSGERTTASFDLGPLRSSRTLPYAVRHEGGRTIARGVMTASPPLGPRVTLDRPYYTTGGTIRAAAIGMDPGAITITGPGSTQSEHIGADKVFELTIPSQLPSGVYPVIWEFNTRTGQHQEGIIPVKINGIEVRCTGREVVSGKNGASEVRLSIDASDVIKARAKLWLVGPDGKHRPAEERAVAIAKGLQTITIPFAFRPDQAGMWHLLYTFTTSLPEGPGLDQRMVTLNAGRVALDAGPAAIIGLTLGQPMYYDTSVAAMTTVYVYSNKQAKVELLVDGDRAARKRIEGSGTAVITVPLGDLKRGRHALAATVTADGLKVRRSLSFLYGARLPDLAVTLRTSDVVSPLLEVGVGIMNQGKVASGQTTVVLSDGDPARGGKLIGSSPVPPLEPGKQFVVILPWELAGKAGAHQLFAAVDQDGSIIETSAANNSASAAMNIPTLLLSLLSQKESYAANDDIRYRARIVNFSPETFRTLNLTLQITDPAGGVVTRATVTLPEIPPGEERTIEQPLGIASPKEGTYLVSGLISSAKPLASDSLGITILPTLLLSGTLEGTPSTAVPCTPLEIRYSVRDAGNIPALNGTLLIEIRSAAQDQQALVKQLPFRLQPGTVRLENVDLPRGDYSIVFRGSAVNSQWDQRREFMLSRQRLTVAGPVDVTRSVAAIPRVLVWAGGETATTIEQAIAEKMVKEAFDGQTAYYALVGSAEAFRSQALTGVFNTYLLLEVSEIGGTIDVLQHSLRLGHGVIIAGSGDHSRSLAEALGFRFAPVKRAASSMSFPGATGLGLTGSLPISGQVLSVSKSGAKTVAVLPDGRASAALDSENTGKVLVAPFSPTRSALNAGSSVPYGLLLRSAVRAVMPEQEAPGASAVQLRTTSRRGPTRARIVETLPPGAEVLWMSVDGRKGKDSLTFEITADQEPKMIFYLFRAPGTDHRTATEVFSECSGNMVSQGKVE